MYQDGKYLSMRVKHQPLYALAHRELHELPKGLQLMYSEANGYVDNDTDNGKNLTVKVCVLARMRTCTSCRARAVCPHTYIHTHAQPAEHLEPKFKALKGNGGLSSGKDEGKLLLQTSSLNYGGYQVCDQSRCACVSVSTHRTVLPCSMRTCMINTSYCAAL